jgi:SAM-dependent methyltransferase
VLARHYSKLAGNFEQAAKRQLALLGEVGVTPEGGRAVDLGAGAGLQAVPLARAGVHVTAVDSSLTLLGELTQRARDLPITTIAADMLGFLQRPGATFTLAVCMGDTLLHLASRSHVQRLFTAVLARLEPGAAFVISLRDLTQERTGLDRFLTLVNEPGLRMRCFLEYQPDHVLVHDFIDELGPDGSWTESRGVYPKLRLSPAWVQDELQRAGFAAVRATSVDGFWCMRGSRPSDEERA